AGPPPPSARRRPHPTPLTNRRPDALQPGGPDALQRLQPSTAPHVRRPRLAAGHGGGQVAFDVDVGVIGDVEDNLDDLAAGELEAVRVGGAHLVAAVAAD